MTDTNKVLEDLKKHMDFAIGGSVGKLLRDCYKTIRDQKKEMSIMKYEIDELDYYTKFLKAGSNLCIKCNATKRPISSHNHMPKD